MNAKFIFYFIASLVFLISCEDEKGPVLKMNDLIPQEITHPAEGSNFIISADNQDSTLSITWNKAEFGLPVSGVTYIVLLDLESKDFNDAEKLASTTDLSVDISYSDLDKIIKGFGIEAAISTPLKIKITSHVSDQLEQNSQVVHFNATPYF
jgi:hypothetical protein